MRSRFTRLGLGLTMAIALTAVGAGVTLAEPSIACTPNTCTIIDFFQDGTQADYWKTYGGNNFDSCEKVDTSDTPITLSQNYKFLVIHSGAHYYIWQPAPAGQYSADQTTSFYVVCDVDDGPPVSDVPLAPTGHLGGPCADPAYYAVFDNTASGMTVKFRFRWYNKYGLNTAVKQVPGGDMYTTWQHWAKPGTYVSVWYKNPLNMTWVLLERQLVVKGSYPACDYQPGWVRGTSG